VPLPVTFPQGLVQDCPMRIAEQAAVEPPPKPVQGQVYELGLVVTNVGVPALQNPDTGRLESEAPCEEPQAPLTKQIWVLQT